MQADVGYVDGNSGMGVNPGYGNLSLSVNMRAGLKMIGDFSGVHVGTQLSLAIVASLLGGGVGLSLFLPETDPDPRK